MPQNKIQLQPGISLSELVKRFGTEAQWEAALERARWPSGFLCPACGQSGHSTFIADGDTYWRCAHCRAQTSVLTGTPFHDTKLPLTKWFQAVKLVTQNQGNISARSLKRPLGCVPPHCLAGQAQGLGGHGRAGIGPPVHRGRSG